MENVSVLKEVSREAIEKLDYQALKKLAGRAGLDITGKEDVLRQRVLTAKQSAAADMAPPAVNDSAEIDELKYILKRSPEVRLADMEDLDLWQECREDYDGPEERQAFVQHLLAEGLIIPAEQAAPAAPQTSAQPEAAANVGGRPPKFEKCKFCGAKVFVKSTEKSVVDENTERPVWNLRCENKKRNHTYREFGEPQPRKLPANVKVKK